MFSDELNNEFTIEDFVHEDTFDETNEINTNNGKLQSFKNFLVKEGNFQNHIVNPNKNNNYTRPQQNFIQQQIPPRQLQKNKISYDDILRSMNMQVKDGKLEIIKSSPKETNYDPQVPYENNPYQNSYIHNKYFKNNLRHEEPIHSSPLTLQERRSLFIKKKIEIETQRRRISQIKSKKLNYSTGNINVSPMRHPNDSFRLFKLIGK
jgi:hypothetical protein